MGRHRKNAIRVKNIQIKERPAKWGYAFGGVIHIDTTCIGLKRMEILIHEALHILYPDATEKQVEHHAVCLSKTLWKENYRYTDNQNLQKLQV